MNEDRFQTNEWGFIICIRLHMNRSAIGYTEVVKLSFGLYRLKYLALFPCSDIDVSQNTPAMVHALNVGRLVFG